jgi:hypothetical protein
VHHLRYRIGQMIEPLQQLAGVVEPFGFYVRAGAIHMSQLYNHM